MTTNHTPRDNRHSNGIDRAKGDALPPRRVTRITAGQTPQIGKGDACDAKTPLSTLSRARVIPVIRNTRHTRHPSPALNPDQGARQ